MPVRYVGATNIFRGKYLFEILRNLKQFGIGRMVVRSTFDRYPEPCYYIVREVNPEMDPEGKNGTMFAETVFRGRNLGIQEVGVGDTDIADWRLIPKEDEEGHKTHIKSTVSALPPKQVIPAVAPFPPLLRRFMFDEGRKTGKPLTEEPMLPLILRRGPTNNPIQEGVEVPLSADFRVPRLVINPMLPQSMAGPLFLASKKKV